MTLFVKNEHDIIIDNIFYHLACGVDEIIITDNGSTDGTYELLSILSNDFANIHLTQEEGFEQEIFVNRMAEMASRQLGATIVFHNDADEFWCPFSSSNLKDSFLAEKKDSMLVKRKNVLPDYKICKKDFPQDDFVIIDNPIKTDDIADESLRNSFFLFDEYPKVIFSTKKDVLKTEKGNHNFADKPISNFTNNIVIYHLPFRSYSRFKDKITMISDGYESQKDRYSVSHGWNTKRFNKIIKDGNYDNLVKLLLNIKPKYRNILENFDYSEKIQSRCRTIADYTRYKILQMYAPQIAGQYQKIIRQDKAIKDKDKKIGQLKKMILSKNSTIADSKSDFDMIVNSNCWKITQPVRETKDFIKQCLRDIMDK